MCGIVGVRRFDGGPVSKELLSDMSAALHHRGPDDHGLWCDGPVGFAHTRLSIIDLAASAQPMTGARGTTHLTFNGEILNYRELRSGLDYPFTSRGDTEVLLGLYERYGPAGVSRLRGQFAYALHDSETGETHLFRDRLGILPLYYYATETLFAFASEIKALYPVIERPAVDTASLHDFLAHRSVPAPYTFIEGVRKVPQGHHLVVRADGSIHTEAYWRLPRDADALDISPAAAVELLDEALRASVRDALVADVPVGAYLSGGVDSSLICALVAAERGGAGLHTFSAGFGDERVDETHWARMAAKIVGSTHHETVITANDFQENWARLSWHRDSPLSEPADVAVYGLARLAREQVKVVLSGEGSDELFGGYPKYGFARATRLGGVVPKGPLRLLEQRLPANQARLTVALRALSEPSYAERMRGWFAPFTSLERDRLLGGPPARTVLDPYLNGRGDSLRRMLYADTHTWLADNLLERGDRMSMAASLELRPPFLDHRVAELAFRLPSSVKVRGGTTKWIVKELARHHLPVNLVDRPKVGFKVPLDEWFRGHLREMAFDLLDGPSSFVGSHFDRGAVRRLLDGHTSGARDEQPRIWTLLSLEVWHRELQRRLTG
ncbi:asparagine synthase (glutamine-hydrolyzing) [Nocardia acidivorans]|uniref:asparagine synthase (glutamine-hydrolyzing) n=1 Tax=Nocardia acidivorans TaxID=404580 RepID=UPI000832EAC9|nr:asparagine synthase (glutamine-hydrolyzing) [Nocardia acidivorans]